MINVQHILRRNGALIEGIQLFLISKYLSLSVLLEIEALKNSDGNIEPLVNELNNNLALIASIYQEMTSVGSNAKAEKIEGRSASL